MDDSCPECRGARWICEEHQRLPWPHGACVAGQPCPACHSKSPPHRPLGRVSGGGRWRVAESGAIDAVFRSVAVSFTNGASTISSQESQGWRLIDCYAKKIEDRQLILVFQRATEPRELPRQA